MMSRMKRFAYMAVLAVTVCVMSPLIIKEVWQTHMTEDEMPAGNTSAALNEPGEEETPAPVASTEKSKTMTMRAESEAGSRKPTASADPTQTPSADAAATPQPTEAPKKKEFVTSSPAYFDDALFIGDSRTVGISEYGTLKNADYYADTGMSVDGLYKKAAAIPGGVDFETMLTRKQYGKIYIMLGINEVGNDHDKTIAKYQELIGYVKERQPSAIIYMQANLHVTQSRSDKDRVVNNTTINAFNGRIAQLADGESVFYIDANEIFDDAAGNLNAEYSSDNTHIYAKYYQDWTQWLCGKTIVE